LVYHKTITSSNRIYGGVHPIVSLESHQHNLAPLIKDALKTIGTKPDLIAVTRGPGMGAALSVGLDTANGLAACMDIPIVGVHHMQAHALTPRLDYGLNNKTRDIRPSFPFLTLLVSGGHTILLESTGLTEHKLLAASQNIAVGDCLDKAARELLPREQWGGDGGHVAYGKILEDFAFPNGEADWDFYHPPGTAERDARTEKLGGSLYDFRLSAPLTQKDRHLKLMAFSFTGLGTSVERMVRREGIDGSLKQAVARELFVAAFEHLAKRIHMAMEQMGDQAKKGIPLVVSGGVASNRFLRHL
jgi:N6-L-threonylcarbamoyladenine synthase